MSGTAISLKRPALARVPVRLLGDERLARMAAAGDRSAVEALYERHHGALFRYVLAIVRHQEDAQDVLQTTMANAVAALQRGAPEAPMRPWLFRIAHNEAISALRRRRPATELDESHMALPGDGLERTLEDRRRLALLVSDLQDLPERQRSSLVMRELSGLSHIEIGQALEISPAHVKQAILEARMTLRQFEKGRAMDCADVRQIISDQDGRKLRGRTVRAHLRGCPECQILRASISARKADLALLAPPLAPALSAGLLAHLLGGGGGGGAAGAGKVAGTTLLIKALAGAAVVATVGAGVAATEIAVRHDRAGRASKSRKAPATEARVANHTTPSPVAATPALRGRGVNARTPTPEPRVRVRRARARTHAPRPAAGTHPSRPPSATDRAEARAVHPKVKSGKAHGHAKTPQVAKAPKPAKTPRPAKTRKPRRSPKPARTPNPDAAPKATPTVTAGPKSRGREK